MNPRTGFRAADECRTGPSRAVFLLLVLVSSCVVATPDPIRGEDHSVFAARLRASLPIGTVRDDGSDTLDLELTRDEGAFTQTLEGIDFIRLDDIRIDAPAEVEAEFELTTASVMFHRHIDSDSRLSGGWAAGLGVSRLDLEVSAGVLRESDVRTAMGPVMAGELVFEMSQDLDAFTRLTLTAGFPSTYLNMLDVGAQWRPLPHLGVIAGWHFGYFELTEESDTRSNIEIRSRGPFVTLAFVLPRKQSARGGQAP